MDNGVEPFLVHRSWLEDEALRTLFEILNADETEMRVVGGAVRNALLGEPIKDIDCATTALPEMVIERVEAAGFKVLPTGIDHGTVTVVIHGTAFEVTTLRADTETDGRHATVSFGRDWTEDAKRRDFTMNALSIDAAGNIHDPLNGFPDLVERRVRFIGDPTTRIEEDYLRILRYFRFFATHGSGRPDRDALKAIVRTKSGLAGLSVERVWSELKLLLSADDPERAILWMRTTEVLNVVLPENWGLDQFHWLLNAEREAGWPVDPLLRLQAMIQPSVHVTEAVGNRLKLSNAERSRLNAWAKEKNSASRLAGLALVDFAKELYRGNPAALIDCLVHEFAKRHAKSEDDAEKVRALIDFARDWTRPAFPVSGQDLLDKGLESGPSLGATLAKLESEWVDSGFTLSRDDLLCRL